MAENSAPSLVRLVRVDYFISREPKYSSKYGPEPYVEPKKGKKFPDGVYKVAMAIQEAGLDVVTFGRKETCAWADHVLLGAPAPAPAVSAAAPAAEERPEVTSAPLATAEAASASTAANQPPSDESSFPLGVNVNIAIYTLTLSALELARYDRRPGAEERRKNLEATANAYRNACPERSAAA